ncbi:MAG: ferredoxin reductase [Nocardia sp.]|uniref:NAD(P)/FAD-dependent oxidoreductase n=1 Tax=Nocardia sp. TaxID=1821 RepID=UPI0026364741|nr:FAD-dependent oxidoreductase [Nocardia sp.]MCU1643011.1 ferredoxin reductase [Nocardia sp.]
MTSTARSTDSVVIIGAGHAGATLAGMLRQQNFEGPITLIGDELHPPYHRPPLSKKFTDDAMVQWLKPIQFYADNKIELLLGVHVTTIDRDSGRVILDNGEFREYGTVVIATGATPRRIAVPGADASGVLTLRTIPDARLLGAALELTSALAVIGGGYVGMEVAAVARSKGINVTVVEREDRILARVASAELSRRLTEYHVSRGTRVVTNFNVAGFRTVDGAITSVVAEDCSVIACDHALIGIGAVPNVDLAVLCGVECDAGILVDRVGRTNVAGIMAIGDATRRPHDALDGLYRLESIPSAVEQAKHAAAAIVSSHGGAHETPWFWSDQFELKLKIAGLLEDEVTTIARPGASLDSFALFHLRRDWTVCAVETANSPKDFMAGKKLISERLPVDPAVLADGDVSLRDVLAARSRTGR